MLKWRLQCITFRRLYVLIYDLYLSISYDNVSTKIYDKRDNFEYDIINFPFFRW